MSDQEPTMLEAMQEQLAQAANGDWGTEGAAKAAIDIYKAARSGEDAAAAPWRELQKAAKDMLTEVIVETGRTKWESDLGTAYIPAPGVTVRYDPKALDALCASDPELAAILAPHRKESERAGSLTIR